MVYYILCLFLSFQILKSNSPLSERYHTYSEIDSILHELNEEFGDTLNINFHTQIAGQYLSLLSLVFQIKIAYHFGLSNYLLMLILMKMNREF